MGNVSKVVYDKLPMFYGQLVLQGYCKNPSLGFAAVGDHLTDGFKSPIPGTEKQFESGF